MMSSPPVPEDAFRATKYEVGFKVKYIGDDFKWHKGEIVELESSENGKKYKVKDADNPDSDKLCHMGDLCKLRTQD